MGVNNSFILAGDVGGTKTALALYSVGSDPRKPERTDRLPSASFDAFADLVQAFLADGEKVDITCATIGVAGPVIDNKAKLTNLPWNMDAEKLAKRIGAKRATLLNDLQAIAYAVPALQAEDIVTLNPGEAEGEGAIGVIAPGTGLGEAFLVPVPGGHLAYPSEGGHCSFSPVNDLQEELLAYMRKHHEHVSFERVCSGNGIPNLYAFLRDSGRYDVPDWLRESLAEADDMTPVIVNAAMDPDKTCEICHATVDMFIGILGIAAGNLALKLLATGGIYLGGGIPPRIINLLRETAFMDSYTNKGRFSDLLERIPVHVIMNPRAALWGAAAHALKNC